jgi:choline kinase
MSQNCAIILAAGSGKRLRPLTDKIPKCLIRVGGRSILGRQIDALKKNNIRKIYLVVGYLAVKVQEFVLKNFPDMDFEFVFNEHPNTNTLYSLALAAEKIENCNVYLLNGDVVFDDKIIKKIKKGGSFIAVKKGKCHREEIKAVLTGDGSIAALNKRIDPILAVGEAIGINKFSSSFWRALRNNLLSLKEDFANEYFEYAIETVLAENKKIFPFFLGSLQAVEIDFLEDFAKARSMFGAAVRKTAT